MKKPAHRNLPLAKPFINGQEERYVKKALMSGWISSRGEFIDKFESSFAKYCGAKYGISVSNGTVGLHLALKALGVGDGDEVIVPSLTFVATANAVVYCGAKPVFIDINENDWCIDPEKIEENISNRTKAIIAVHLYGHPADMRAILSIAKRHKLSVIEDAAEAHGADIKGKKVGSFGDIAVFSFFGNKIITTGEGGMLVTNNKKLHEKATLLKNHGMDQKKKYWHPVIGFNYRMTNLQAAVGLAQVEKLGRILREKERIFKTYNKLFLGFKEVILAPKKKGVGDVCWLYSILIKNPRKRDGLIKHLSKKGIESRPFFYPIEEMPPYKKRKICPVSLKISRMGINIPSATDMSNKDIERVVCEVKKYLSSRKGNNV